MFKVLRVLGGALAIAVGGAGCPARDTHPSAPTPAPAEAQAAASTEPSAPPPEPTPVTFDLCVLSESGTRLVAPTVFVRSPDLGMDRIETVSWESGVVTFTLLPGRYDVLIANGEHRLEFAHQLTEPTRHVARVKSEPHMEADDTSGCIWPERQR